MPAVCLYQIGGVTAQDAANQAAVGSAVVGTAIGALAGAAIGGSQGAAVGAGVGLVGGSAYGANSAYASGYGTQRQYNNAYIQCMYVKGHSVPVPAGMAYQPRVVNNPQNGGIPPPPPGAPPPPPACLRHRRQEIRRVRLPWRCAPAREGKSGVLTITSTIARDLTA